jgi:hypothetical protein
MIQVTLTPEQFTAKAAQLKQEQGIDLTGDSGVIEHGTPLGKVVANWLYRNNQLTVTVVKHPFGITAGHCEDEIHAWLASS